MSAASSSLTLTYGRDADGNVDHFRSQYLVYSDLRGYFKRLRANGYPLRFFAVGEYGSKKSRAHWHVLIFWQKAMPSFRAGETLHGEKMRGGEAYPHDGNFMERHWPHGWTYWRDFQFKEIRYVCKYMLKAEDDEEAMCLARVSKRPPLGAEFFRREAGRWVEQGLCPPAAEYTFRDVRKPNGDKLVFRLRRQSLDIFAGSYLEQWYAKHGPRHPPVSKDGWLEDWCDKQARVSSEGWKPAPSPRPAERPWIETPEGAGPIEYDRGGKLWHCRAADGVKLFWSFDASGRRCWSRVYITEAEGGRLANAAADQRRAASSRR